MRPACRPARATWFIAPRRCFWRRRRIRDGVRLELRKNIPLAAGLGGGSGNAATTLLGLNELFGEPLSPDQLRPIAAALGSDVPFFLQDKPALATGRGEQIQPLGAFPALSGAAFLLIHPGFGIATAWAYQRLARFPAALNGRAGPGAKAYIPAAKRGPESRWRGVLQLARSASPGKVSAAGAVPGIPPGERRGRRPHVRQWLDDLCCGRRGRTRRRRWRRRSRLNSARRIGSRRCRPELAVTASDSGHPAVSWAPRSSS